MASTTAVIDAFLSGNAKTIGNLQTDGRTLWLFGNRIAEHGEDGLYISLAGWDTRTTRKYLSYLPNVSLHRKKNETYLNGEQWDGSLTRVTSAAPPPPPAELTKRFITAKRYVKTDGWRGYEEPIYAIAGANDTGTWSDSPCPSDVAIGELNAIKKALGKIPTKEVICETSNVFCIHRYLIVPPYYVDKAREIVKLHLEVTDTRLLYAV